MLEKNESILKMKFYCEIIIVSANLRRQVKPTKNMCIGMPGGRNILVVANDLFIKVFSLNIT
jgi:hypothetical protein